MSEVKRYNVGGEYAYGYCNEHPNHDWVKSEDYDLLTEKFYELKQAFEESQAEVVSCGMKLAECEKRLDVATGLLCEVRDLVHWGFPDKQKERLDVFLSQAAGEKE